MKQNLCPMKISVFHVKHFAIKTRVSRETISSLIEVFVKVKTAKSIKFYQKCPCSDTELLKKFPPKNLSHSLSGRLNAIF